VSSISSIGVVVPSSELEGFRGPFVGAPLQGATSVISAASLQPVLLMLDDRGPGPLTRYLSSGRVDAAVVILLHETERLYRDLGEIECPVVYVGRSGTDLGPESCWVDGDNYAGGRLATRTLVEAGRRRLACITGPSGYLPADRRLEGFRDELEDWGLAPVAVGHSDFSMQSGSMAMANLMRPADKADGLFAASDLIAVGAIRVLNASGRQVPQDISVVGFDDTVVAATSVPALTSVHQPLREMGVRAAELAIEAIQDGGSPVLRQIELPVTLTLRDSV
jgi:DNA-binding LacI/PurR family transcriptional regulator